MSSRDNIIQSLSKDLQPVATSVAVDSKAMLWVLLTAAYVILVTQWLGPIRADAFNQLITVPRFFIESLLGLTAIAMLALCAFRAAVPGRLTARFAITSFALLALWIANYAYGLIDPTLEPSMAGKREQCWLQTAAMTLPPMIAAVLLTRRLYPLSPLKTVFLFSLAAGMIPALYMQMACMYIPEHILKHHILPGLAMAVLGCVLSLFYRK